MATIQEVYIALFGRPADPIGYQYYVDATNNGENLDAVGDLTNSPEYLERFEGMSNAQMVNQIFQDLFGRNADTDGLLFYVGLLNSGAATLQDIAIRIIDGATGTDAEIIANKVEAAQAFTESLNTPEGILAYQGEGAAQAGRDFLDGITEDPDTVPSQDEIDDAIDNLPGDVGDTFTLTTDIGEIVTGTAANDTFNAILDGSDGGAASTLNTFDAIDGAGGRDTLNLIVKGNVEIPGGASIENVEVINLNRTNVTAEAVDASAFVGAEEIWQINNAGAIEGLADGQTAGFRGGTSAVTAGVTYASDATTASIALDGVAGGSTVNVIGNELTTINISGSTANDDDTLDLGTFGWDDLPEISTLNLALENDVNVNFASEEFFKLDTVDASGSTGNLTVNLPDIDAAPTVIAGAMETSTIIGGSGNDTLIAELALFGAENLSIDTGAGNDVIRLDGSEDGEATAVSITLGEGNDRVDFVSLSNIGEVDSGTTVEEIEASLITITDFNGSEDVIGIDQTGLFTLSNTEAAKVAEADDLAAALLLINDYADDEVGADGTLTTFQFEDCTYIYDLENDGLVDLDGFVGTLGATNFVDNGVGPAT